MKAWEVNFDGIVGPTHNYAGLSFGNVASSSHGGQSSSPRQAALQGLEKAWALTQMGLKQGIIPPQERPHIPTLRNLGFSGSETEVLGQVAKESPQLLAATSSASCMWVANAATISPFADTRDGKTHMTPANLSSMFHRSIEPSTTSRVLQAMFNQ
ncbi:MAG TPA: succinylarginine dihydrolase, partial [Gammaproteobacteria bacterium]|nr:succinylarginine dihydrolase [Gammaproteobacteria bacterium]